LLASAASHDVAVPILNAVLPSNQLQLERGVRAVIDAGRGKVGILGLSFKAGTDDLRESPVVELVERLLGKGFDLRVYDGNVNMAQINGTNRDYVLNRIPHISRLMVPSIDTLLAHAQTIVIGNSAPEFKDVPKAMVEGQVLVDLVRIADMRSVAGVYEGISW
jgi:GDP-mannose 6-dehydrogenase